MLGRRREMGLGPWPDVTIAEAREQAAKARRIIRDGRDPIEERLKRKQYNKHLTLAETVAGCFEARQAELKDDGKAGHWLSPLELHVLPKIGKHAVEDIDQHIIKQTLEPIWHTKADTARKAINRLNLTLKHAAALGLDVDMQATMKRVPSSVSSVMKSHISLPCPTQNFQPFIAGCPNTIICPAWLCASSF